MHKKLGLIVLLLSFIFSPLALANTWNCGENLRTMVESLNLDKTQKEKIKPILDQVKSAMQDKSSQMNDLENQINGLVSSNNLDEGALNNLIDQKTKLIGDMMRTKLMAKNQIFAILNDKQKADLQSKISKAEQKIADQFKKCHQD